MMASTLITIRSSLQTLEVLYQKVQQLHLRKLFAHYPRASSSTDSSTNTLIRR